MENKIVESFGKDHLEIIKYLNQLSSRENLSSVRSDLEKVSEIISKHLKEEEDFLYSEFLKSDEDEVQKMGRIFSETMNGYALKFEKFVKDVSEASEYDEKLKKDCAYICERIKNRITIEETILYPVFLKYFEK